MRPRNIRPQLVTIRPSVDRTEAANVFGDAPIIAAENRDGSFSVQMTVSWNRNQFSTEILGQSSNKAVTGILWKKDLAKPDRADYEPKRNDIIEVVGAKLFVTGVEPVGHSRIGLGNARGGHHGWRITLSDNNPGQRAATAYDS